MSRKQPEPSLTKTGFQTLGLALATWRLNVYSQQGESWAAPAALATAGLLLGKAYQLFAGYQKHCFRRSRFKRFTETAKRHATGRFVKESELENAELFSTQGLFLGSWKDEEGRDRDIRYDGQNACLLLGPPEAGKTTSALIPSLMPIQERRGNGIGHAVVCNDPNGEGFAILRDALVAAGCRVLCICPFARELSKKLGIEVKDAGLNLWSQLDLNGDAATTHALITDVSAMLIAIGPRDDSKDRFFKNGAKLLLSFFQEYCISLGKIPTPSMLYELASRGPAGIVQLCDEIASNEDDLEAGLVKQAATVKGYATTASEQFAGYLGCCLEALRLYDAEGVFGAHFTPDGLDPRTIKDDPKTVVFIMYPTQKAASHDAPLNLTFTHIVEQLAADPRPSRRVTILIDETSGAGQLPLTRWVSEYRKFGIRCVMCFQELAGQAERIYGAYTVKEFLAACEVVWASNVREPSTLDMLSKKTGEAVFDDRSINDPARFDPSADGQQTFGRSYKTRPVMRSDDIRRLDRQQALVIAGNLHAFLLSRVPYWTREAWNGIASPNPYRQQKDKNAT